MKNIPLLDAIDCEILMHKEAHFGGSFVVMLEYYQGNGVGAMQDFEQKRIAELAHIEKELDEDLSEIILPEAAHIEIEKSKQLYLDLREVYEKDPPDAHALLISNLILDEHEYPQEAIEATIQGGQEVTPLLIDILDSELFYDPLYPGYGRCPILAAECLAKLKNPRAIPALFRAMRQENFYTDEAMIKALKTFGEDAKKFLLKRLQQTPFSKDNTYAAIALMEFSDHEDVALCCLQLLESGEVFAKPELATYLIFGASALIDPSHQQRFKSICDKQAANSDLRREMEIVISNFSK